MAYGTPSDPVAGTVITVAWAVANVLTPIRWLRLLTGNADPPGSSYVVVSDSTTGTTWRKIPTDAIADLAVTAGKLAAGVAVANLGYTPVNKAGDSMSGQLLISRTQGASSTAFAVGPLVVQSLDAVANAAETAGIGLYRYLASGVYVYHAGASAANLLRIITNLGADGTIWSSLNQGAASGLHADLLDGFHAGNGSGVIPVSNGFVNTDLNADLLDGFHAGNGAGAIPVSNGSVNTTLNADKVDGFDATATPGVSKVVASDGSGTVNGWVTAVGGKTPTATPGAAALPLADGSGTLNSWVTAVGGLTPTATPTAGAIPKADGSGKLDGWVTASGGVPSGLGGWVRQASEVPVGYTRESNLDGRIPVGAGTTFSTTFTEATNYGSAWSFTPSDSGHSHTMAAAGVGGSTGAESADNGLGNGGGTSVPAVGHTHPSGGLDVTGSSDSASAVITSTTWTIPSRGVVWVRKN